MPATTTQDLFNTDYLADPRDWLAVRILCDEIEAEMAERRRHLLRRLCDWLTLLAVFRQIEERKVLQNDPTHRDKSFHRAILTSVLGSGELLLLDLRDHTDVDPSNVGVAFEDFEAHIVQLRYDLQQHYGDMTDLRRSNILQNVFGKPQPPA